MFPDATCMTMLKSYRSTYEITRFTQRVNQKAEVEAIERHGEAPVISAFNIDVEELHHIKHLISEFQKRDFKTLGIICKTQGQADTLYESLKDTPQINRLNAVSVAFGSGIIITTTAHLAKGLEFDAVIVPFCTESNYRTAPDRQMLYVACTRAMHRLYLTHSEKLTGFLS